MDLSDVHKVQLSRYSTYFTGKRVRAIADRDSELGDFKSDRLMDEGAIYNYADVLGLLDAYHQQVMGRFREQLDKTVSLSAVYISQLLAQAEASGQFLQVDMSVIEDQSRLDQIHAISAMAPAMAAPPLAPKPRPTLEAMGAGAVAASDSVALLQQLNDLKAQNRLLTDRNLKVETELTNISRERSVLASQLEQAQFRPEEPLGPPAGQAEPGETAQFRQLKAIVQQKNIEVKELKQRLISAGLMLPEADGGGVTLHADDD